MRIVKSGFRCLAALAVVASLTVAVKPTQANAQEAENIWANVQKAGVLRCGAAVFPPYVMRDPTTGAYSGFFSNLCRQFGEEVLKVKVEFVDTTWDNLVAGLQAKKWDLSLALNRTPTRAMAVAFSVPATPYEVTLVHNKANTKIPAGASSVANIDIKGMTIAVVSGTSMDKSVTPMIKNATLLRLPSSDEARLALISRRADILADPSDSNQLFLKANADWAVVINPSPAIAKQGVGFGLRKGVSRTDLDALNIFIEEKIATGQVDALVEEALQQALKDSK